MAAGAVELASLLCLRRPARPRGAPRGVRKTVTVLFCDVSGSTGLGRPQEALAVAQEALRLYEAKGNLVSAGRVKAVLEQLGPASRT